MTSVLQPHRQGLRLAPFYDLMCTRLYPGLSPAFALRIGGEARPGHITAHHIDGLAQQLKMRPQFLRQRADELAQRLPVALEQASEELRPAMAPGARTVAQQQVNYVNTTTRKMATRWLKA